MSPRSCDELADAESGMRLEMLPLLHPVRSFTLRTLDSSVKRLAALFNREGRSPTPVFTRPACHDGESDKNIRHGLHIPSSVFTLLL